MELKMISQASAASYRRRSAFSLTEMLVVIGILVLLAAILTPMLMKTYREADRIRTAADMQSISQGLEAFKLDFGDYPRPDSAGANSGFAALGRYLIGPGPADSSSTTYTQGPPFQIGSMYYVGTPPNQTQYVCVNATSTTTAPPSTDWVVQNFFDGVDSFGIHQGVHSNKKYGPYLQPDKFRTHGLAIVDKKDNPILYFPAPPGHPNIHLAQGYATVTPNVNGNSLYNLADGEVFFREAGEPDISNAPTNAFASVHTMMVMLGDTGANGAIDVDANHGGRVEKELTTGPYLLWAAGPDGIYGILRAPNADPSQDPFEKLQQEIDGCDDVTNFR